MKKYMKNISQFGKKSENFIQKNGKKVLSIWVIIWAITLTWAWFMNYTQAGQNLALSIDEQTQKVENTFDKAFDKYDINYELEYSNSGKVFLKIENENDFWKKSHKWSDHDEEDVENEKDEKRDNKESERKVKVELKPEEVEVFKKMNLAERKAFANSFIIKK